MEVYDKIHKEAEMLTPVMLTDPPAAPLEKLAKELQADKEEDEKEAKYILVESDKGRMLRLHRVDGCWRARAPAQRRCW